VTVSNLARRVAPVEHALLSGLSDADRRHVLARTVRRSYRKDETLFHEGDPGESLHLVERGRVAIRASTRNGDVVILAVLRQGDSFGEQALLGPQGTRIASAVALEPVETRTLHRDEFDALRREHPSVERLLVDVLAAQVRRLTVHLLDALYLPVERRVVHRLAELAEIYFAGGSIIDIPLRQEDLAALAGTTRSTTNRVLQELASEGVVALRRGRVVVISADALAERAR
jgi:CRP/FNR family transcriptional regulator, cyclic AMP receptor protein